MTVSVVIATYNGDKYINEQLDSLLKQTRLPDEVIISDDCSTDNTISILEQFKSLAPFPTTILKNKTNVGYTRNFSRGLLKARGDLIFLCDQDDSWFTHKIECMEELAEKKKNFDVFLNDCTITDENLLSSGKTKLQIMDTLEMPDHLYLMGCCAVIRKSYLETVIPIPKAIKGHDDWIVGISDALGKKYIYRESLQYYRRHSINTSQFIANSANALSVYSRIRTNLLSINNKAKSREAGEKFLDEKKKFAQSIQNLMTEGLYLKSPQLGRHLDRLNNEIDRIQKRQNLRKRNLLYRLYLAPLYYFKLYDKRTRLKNMLRDIFG